MTSPVHPDTSADLDAHAQSLLRTLTGDPTASLRDGQLDAIRSLVVDRRRTLVVQRTGWGKSAVYFIATRLLRDTGSGPTLLLSPLLALMRNQIEAAERMGIRAATINSANVDEWAVIREQLDRDEIDLLLISPERLANPSFRREVLPTAAGQSGLLVIDEAHCISDWGHDFRPDYRRVVRVLDLLPPGLPVLCCTATANDRVVADIEMQLGTDLVTIRGPLSRDGLALEVVDLPSAAERLAWLTTFVRHIEGSGIIYCLTIDDTERVAAWLRRDGIAAAAYSGRTDPTARESIERSLLTNEIKALVATSALGMGFDKPDLAFVVHFQSPGSPIAYYQQVGRAGRRLAASHGVLLRGVEDREIQDWFIATAFPPADVAEQVVALLADRAAPVSLPAIEAAVNVKHSRLENMLKVLEVDGAVERGTGGWSRTDEEWVYDHARVDAVTASRRIEQAAMDDYATGPGCRMVALRAFLDDPDDTPCGICDRCAGPQFDQPPDPVTVAAAREHLREGAIPIEPRRSWPSGVDPRRRGNISPDVRMASGRSLSRLGDGGWGPLVEAGLTGRTPIDAALIEAARRSIEQWQPDPAPRWVTFIPSQTRPSVISDLAGRLADALSLPLVDAVRLVHPHPPQWRMANSAQRLRNVWGSYEAAPDLLTAPVLLVDDLVDSRWTLTEVSAVLRAAGVEAVHPFVLATGTTAEGG